MSDELLRTVEPMFAIHRLISDKKNPELLDLGFKVQIKWCLGPDLNRHARVNEAQDFKSCVSTNFTTEALNVTPLKVKLESK